MASPAVSESLAKGLRSLDGVAGCEVLGDPVWNVTESAWTLRCRLTIRGEAPKQLPRKTEWYLHVDPRYPQGDIEAYPAKLGGLALTFPHQSRNDDGAPDVPWRAGHPCLDTTVKALGRHDFDDEPREPETRLQWRVERALAWLGAADRDELQLAGEPFELPGFLIAPTPVVAFSEEAETWAAWQEVIPRRGLVSLRRPRHSRDLWVVEAFQSSEGVDLVRPRWGKALREPKTERAKGLWMRLDSVPVLPPWQAPRTWGELDEALSRQKIVLWRALREFAYRLRLSDTLFALIGFPMPERIGEAPRQMHWQAMQLPALTKPGQERPGFRETEEGRWRRDRAVAFAPSATIAWLSTRNWRRDELLSRGSLPDAVAVLRVVVLGAGALGAVVAELLVRAGVTELTVVDGDRVEGGNLCRHPLTMADVGRMKAQALAERLNAASPHANVKCVAHNVEGVDDATAMVAESDLVIDCTGDDEILAVLADVRSKRSRWWVSLSVGLGARRLFCFATHGPSFSANRFAQHVGPWIRDERVHAVAPLPREGVGCWHPVFPARVDELWLMASIAIPWMMDVLDRASGDERFTVFERGDGADAGCVRRVAQSDDGREDVLVA